MTGANRLRIGYPGLINGLVLSWLAVTTAVLVRAWNLAPPTWLLAAVGVLSWAVGLLGLRRFWRRPAYARLVDDHLQLDGLFGRFTRERLDLRPGGNIEVREQTIRSIGMGSDFDVSPTSTKRVELLVRLPTSAALSSSSPSTGPSTGERTIRPGVRLAIIVPLQRRRLERTLAFADRLAATTGSARLRDASEVSGWRAATNPGGYRWVNPPLGTGSSGGVVAFVACAVAFFLLWDFAMVYGLAGPTFQGKRLSQLTTAQRLTTHLNRIGAEIPPPPGGETNKLESKTTVSDCERSPSWLWGPTDVGNVEVWTIAATELPPNEVAAREESAETERLTDLLESANRRETPGGPWINIDLQVITSQTLDGRPQARLIVHCVRDGDDPALVAALEHTAGQLARHLAG